MAAERKGMRLVDIYAPSEAEKKQEGEGLFNIDLPHLIKAIPTTMTIGGEFICALSKKDCMGHLNYSRALNYLVRGFDLIDMWEAATKRGIYTHYTRQGATRPDRKSETRNLRERKCGAETMVAAFTDYLAVVLGITLEVATILRGRGYWKMNVALLQDTRF